MSPNRERLEKFEKEGLYLFHGSDAVIEEFEPRQAHTRENDEVVPDGEPAVFASPFIDFAIFMAIINMTNCPKGFRAGSDPKGGVIEYCATKETLEQLQSDSRGYVYVFTRESFTPRQESEWVSYTKVKPIEVVEVTWTDFTKKVSEISE
jgi:hypothetical protein